MIGKTVSHYKILEKLGQGGMGVVYKALDTRLDRGVAVKFLPVHLTADAAAKERFLREAKTASSLDHPNILTIHEVDETAEGELFIVMALYEGRALGDLIKEGPLPRDRAAGIAAQIAAGLAHAHEKGILHRDIKPANVFLTTDGQVKILDFGLARLTDQTRVTQEGAAVGTLSYMSPEQITGADVDDRTDIFSLGVVLYEMLTGHLPFKGENQAAMVYSISNDEPEPIGTYRDDVPDDLAVLIESALDKNPQERPPSAAAMAEGLRELVGSGAVSHAPPAGPLPQPAATDRTGRRWGLTALIVIVLAVIFGPRLLRRGGEVERPFSGATDAPRRGEPVHVTLKQVTFDAGVEEYPAFSPDGSRIAYCGEVDGFRQVFVKDLASGDTRQVTSEERDHIQPAWGTDNVLYYVRATADGGMLEPGDVFGIHSGGDIWRHDVATGEAHSIIPDAYNPAPSPDGTRLAFDTDVRGARHIMVADAHGHNARQVTTGRSEGVAHYLPKWSPDGTHIVFQQKASTDFDVAVVGVAGTDAHVLSTISGEAHQDMNPVWHPSGRAIYFSSSRTGGMNVWRVPVDASGKPTGPAQQVTAGAGKDVQLSISPDGHRLAMSILRINADLWRLPVSPETGMTTGAPEALVATTREDSRGSWSPDGRMIAFNSDRDGNMNIWICDANGRGARQLTHGPGGDYQPQWSPDASRLVFFSSRAGNADIWTVTVGENDPALTPLTTYAGIDINPFYSPDGRHIAWQSDNGGRNEVWVMNADGTGARQLSETGLLAHFTLWTSDSRYVIFRTMFEGQRQMVRVSIDSGYTEGLRPVKGGSHMSFSPNRELIMDVTNHETLWVTPLGEGPSREVFTFGDEGIRIDYPRWSPDGKWILFDGVKSQGGDIWVVEGI